MTKKKTDDREKPFLEVYRARKGKKCPFCESDQIIGYNMDFGKDHTTAELHVDCRICGTGWMEYWEIVRVKLDQ